MKPAAFRALWVTQASDQSFRRDIVEKPIDILPTEDVLIRVHYSSLNYKDSLSATGNRGVTRSYPHIPGVDAAGTVVESRQPGFQPGDEVIVTGHELGSNAWGGWSEFIRVPASWVVPLPKGLTLHESMCLGTAGFTAGLAALKILNQGLTPGSGPVLVTGATGGVGCVAVAILAKLGFSVTAITGKEDEHSFLKSLGAVDILGRTHILDKTDKPLLSGRWASVVDTVGGPLLESAIRQTKLEGAIACCGNIASAELHTSIYPFILRGITLYGIGSAFTPMKTRLDVWKHLATDWKPDQLPLLTINSSLEELNTHYIDRIRGGGIRGRVVVKLA